MSRTYSTPYPCNAAVGYENDKVIVKQDDGLLFFMEMPENLIALGETIHPSELTPISVLSVDEQNSIKNKYADAEV